MSKATRPTLRFVSVDEMIAYVDRLRTGGYEAMGKWNLPRMLDHLAKGFSIPFMVDPPMVPAIARPAARFFIGVMVWGNYYPTLRFPAPRELCPAEDVLMDEAYPSFIAAATRMRDYSEERMCTPFGIMRTEKYRRLQLLHAGHHLGYLRVG